MDLQQVSVKVFATAATRIDQQELIPIFHRWIREKRLGDHRLLIDVADYRHVPEGPGMMIVADDGHYAMDSRGGELGFQYARKRDEAGPAEDRIAEAFGRAVRACHALAQEPSVAGRVAFDYGSVEVSVLSRLVAPNTPASYAALAAAVSPFAARVYGTPVQLSHHDTSRGPLRARLTVSEVVEIKTLLAALPDR